MLKKLRLDQTKVYERQLALEEISKMLVSFVNGQPHHLAIGAEQGGIDKWDDLVIQRNNSSYIYIQAKRQNTHFSTYSVQRETYTNRKKEIVQRELSPIDETLQSLGKRVSESRAIDKNEYWIELPNGLIQIKKNLEIRHLGELCETQIKSITTPADLLELSNYDSNVKNIYIWLTTWCDFVDWEHILKALRLLRINYSGLAPDINRRAINNLSQIFKTNELDEVKRVILSYLEENETFAGAIKPRQLLCVLKEYLLPNIAMWSQYMKDGHKWNISGIHDLEDNNEIERPSVIVPSLWALGNPNARRLKIYGDCSVNCFVSESLMRLALHPRGSFDIICSHKSSWHNSIMAKTGGTLGLSKDDFNDTRILDGLELCWPSDYKEITSVDAMEQISQELHNEMHKVTFRYVDRLVFAKIQELERCELRTAVDQRWTVWRSLLETSVDEQRELFSRMLHPRAEGKSISGELRVGPKTVNLLSEAIYLLLVVSVCLGEGHNQTWKSVTDKLKMTSVGLAYWSGPAEGKKKVIEIDDNEGISKLLENEAEQIIIIPQSELPDVALYNDDIAGDITKIDLLTHPKYPKLLITQDYGFKRKIKNGIIAELREYFQHSLDRYKDIRDIAVDKVVG